MVVVTRPGPIMPANTPPPMTSDSARARLSGETPSVAAKRKLSATAA